MPSQPLIAITAETSQRKSQHETTTYFQVMEKYVTPVSTLANGLALLLPPLADQLDQESLLESIDGLLLTGGASNIEPEFYQSKNQEESCTRDPKRDATVIPLIKKVIERGIPLLGICRGMQEMNVALGGSLHQQIWKDSRFTNHTNKVDFNAPADELYGPAHAISIKENGLLQTLCSESRYIVNSVHGQSIDQLAPELHVEAVADDGMIEAVSVKNATSFALAVQWHPEWRASEHPLYRALFTAFGQACLEHRKNKSVYSF